MEEVKLSLDEKSLMALDKLITEHEIGKKTFSVQCRGPYQDLPEPVTALVTIGAGTAQYQKSFVLCPRLQNDMKYINPDSPMMNKTDKSSEPYCYTRDRIPPVVTEEEFYANGIFKCPYVK